MTDSLNWDFLTLKYAPAGTLTWEKQWDGGSNRTDLPQAMAVDNLGSVVVTGSSDVNATAVQHLDFVTIKYSGGK